MDYSESTEIIRLLLDYFEESVPDRINKCIAAVEVDDFKELKFQLHALKNSFLNIGANYVSEKLLELENYCQDLEKSRLISDIENLKLDFNFVLRSVQSFYEEVTAKTEN